MTVMEIYKRLPEPPDYYNRWTRKDAWKNPYAEIEDEHWIVADWEFGQDVYPYYKKELQGKGWRRR